MAPPRGVSSRSGAKVASQQRRVTVDCAKRMAVEQHRERLDARLDLIVAEDVERRPVVVVRVRGGGGVRVEQDAQQELAWSAGAYDDGVTYFGGVGKSRAPSATRHSLSDAQRELGWSARTTTVTLEEWSRAELRLRRHVTLSQMRSESSAGRPMTTVPLEWFRKPRSVCDTASLPRSTRSTSQNAHPRRSRPRDARTGGGSGAACCPRR